MFQTSQDVFFVVASIAIVWVGVFLCWALYRLTIFLRSINDVTLDLKEHIEGIEGWFNDMRSRFARTVGAITAVQKAVNVGLSILERRQRKGSARTSKKDESPSG
ncbi:hypothetical protein HZA86_02110 [Candidatus Uhrbacteria bacterium]|nr:hypothetical protein [Candidatus Uhrbacteria bacterium]